MDATRLLTIEPALAGVPGIDAGPIWIAEVLWGGGTDPGHRTTVIVADSAIAEGRPVQAVIVDGVMQPTSISIDN